MKKTAFTLFSFCLTMAFGQKVSDYKYVSIPAQFKDFEKESYGLENILSKDLTSKKYVVISADKSKWPAEIENPCHVAKADIANTSSFLRNKVTVQFKDCDDKVISEAKGSSSIKEFETGYPDALKNALVGIAFSNPTANLAAVKNTQPAEKESKIAVQNEAKAASKNTGSATVEASKFTNGKIDLQKIQLNSDQFILAQANSSVPYATFTSTAKKDVFRVKLASGESTLGYVENGDLIIEIPEADGSFSKEVIKGK